ncbi:hypothetical protein [Geobacter sp. DSM 9736]|uniref:hypothetical protein n=1 Tax=Geobacter sp. DSM 9736 TaxID=1277350 RepID=UPI000B508105|nr:hypothetical protein [Geobacter sp. DSM 9736]SNB47502.1 hypothetical protein SAMN06269301_2992 [Geobacter sp. DSM 9736]
MKPSTWLLPLSLFLLIPAGVAGENHPRLNGVSPLIQGNIPHEVPIRMMQFPPLQTLRYPEVAKIEMMPLVDGSNLYRQHCSDCHGIQTTSEIRGIRFSQLSSALTKKEAEHPVKSLNNKEMMAIIDALRPSPAS